MYFPLPNIMPDSFPFAVISETMISVIKMLIDKMITLWNSFCVRAYVSLSSIDCPLVHTINLYSHCSVSDFVKTARVIM